MKVSSPLGLLGIVLMSVAATRLSMHMGLTGFSTGLVAMLSVGIIMVVHDPMRKLTERVRVLEEQLANDGKVNKALSLPALEPKHP